MVRRIAAISATASGADAPSRLMLATLRTAQQEGARCAVFYGRGAPPAASFPGELHKINSPWGVTLHAVLGRLLDREGLASVRASRLLLDALDRFSPEVVHLHTLHGHYLHYPTLFQGLAEMKVPVVVTLHDEWLLTGRCAFTCGCKQWEQGCRRCPRTSDYPAALLPLFTSRALGLKAVMLDAIDHLTFVAPSRWMLGRLRRSLLANAACEVIPNGVAPEFFAARSLPQRPGSRTVLAVANRWEPRKHPEHVLAMKEHLPPGWELRMEGGRGATVSPERLAGLMREAAVVVSASEAESFGMTVAEAKAAGTPVVVRRAAALPEHITAEADGEMTDTASPGLFAQAVMRVAARAAEGILPTLPLTEHEMGTRYLTLFNSLLS